MTSEDQLIEYMRASAARRPLGRGQLEQRIEDIFNQLRLDWGKQPDGDWVIREDIGEVHAGLNETVDILSFWQVINELSGQPQEHAELLWALLSLNFASNGAYFALHQPDERSAPVLMILARLAAEKLDTEEVAQSVASLFGMSKACE